MPWRAKLMALNDWGAFQNHFADYFTSSGGDPRLALFMQKEPGETDAKMLIPTFQSAQVELMSPGDWDDHPHPEGAGIALLVGVADAAERFGIELGAHD